MSSSYLIINQLTGDYPTNNDQHTLNMHAIGLSKSRNFGLNNSLADICLISDDDLEYLPNIEAKIIKVFKDYPDADIITFKIINPDRTDRKNYSTEPFYHNLRTVMKVSSVEIALRRNAVSNKISYDENFGLGTQFPTGEETIYLTDAIKEGIKVLYYPLAIVVHPLDSSGSNYLIPNLAKAKGAVFFRIFSNLGYLVCFIFAIKHYRKTPYSFVGFIKEMNQGIKAYKELK